MPKEIRLSLENELKGKLSEVLKCKSGDEIEFYTYPSPYLNGDSTEGIHVVYRIEDRNGNELEPNEADYKEEETFPFEKRERTIDENTAGVIVHIDKMSGLEEQISKDGKISNRKDWIKKCREAAKRGKKFKNSDMKKDKDGNITTTKPKDEKANGDATNDTETKYVSRDDDAR